ncbi:signal peptidase II [Candidatus Curtissbacteria bacterium]|nr:signal peptidase II [Candidatus Curtissbacteria bacterium]
MTRRRWREKNEIILRVIYFSALIIFSIIVIDQATKALAIKFLPTACNAGFAFGIFPVSNLLGAFLVVLVLGIAGYFVLTGMIPVKRLSLLGSSLIFGGGLSNLIDRVARGCVVDFVDVVSFWPSFNLADAAINAGVFLLVFSMVKESVKK